MAQQVQISCGIACLEISGDVLRKVELDMWHVEFLDVAGPKHEFRHFLICR
jgi:hypothetical protein